MLLFARHSHCSRHWGSTVNKTHKDPALCLRAAHLGMRLSKKQGVHVVRGEPHRTLLWEESFRLLASQVMNFSQGLTLPRCGPWRAEVVGKEGITEEGPNTASLMSAKKKVAYSWVHHHRHVYSGAC